MRKALDINRLMKTQSINNLILNTLRIDQLLFEDFYTLTLDKRSNGGVGC